MVTKRWGSGQVHLQSIWQPNKTVCVVSCFLEFILYGWAIISICNGEKGTLPFVHGSHRSTGSQGPPGLGYSPPDATVWLLQAGKAITRGFPPMAVARDVTSYASYRISGRWQMWCYVTVYVMYRWYKSSCNPIPGSPFASLVAGDLSTSLASWATVILSPGPLPGTSEVSK